MNNQRFTLLSPSLSNSVIAVLLLLICWPAQATADEPNVTKAPFAFSQTGVLTLEWEAKGEQKIEIVSTDGKKHTVKIRLGDFGLKDVDGKALPTDEIIKIAPPGGEVLAEAGLIIVIQVSRNMKVKPGIYAGNVLAEGDDESSKGLIVRLQAQLVVPDAQPLVPKLTIFTYRIIPFWNGWWRCTDCSLPLRDTLEAKRTWLRTDVPLGGLRREQGGSASVWWSGQSSAQPGEPPKLELIIKDLKHAGKYEGPIQVNPFDNTAGGKVELIVNASDFFLWPVLVLALGVLLTLLTKRYMGVNRIIWKLREQEAALGVAFKESQRRFTAAAQGQPFAPYSITDSLAQKRREVVKKIDALQNSSSLNIEANNSDYLVILDNLRQLQSQVNAWGGFAGNLEALQTLLDAREDVGTPPPGIEDDTPALLAESKELLQGTTLTPDEFEARQKKLSTALVAIPVWFELKDRFSSDAMLIKQIDSSGKLTETQAALLIEAQGKRATAWDKLWRATGISELEELKAAAGPLESAHQILINIISQLKPAKSSAQSLAFNSWLEGVPPGDSDSYRAMKEMLLKAPADDQARQEFYADARQRWDWALALIAFVIALLTGLNTYYFGQPFGTLKDYVGLFLWAVGTKVAVDTMSTALQWIFSGGLAERLSARTR